MTTFLSSITGCSVTSTHIVHVAAGRMRRRLTPLPVVLASPTIVADLVVCSMAASQSCAVYALFLSEAVRCMRHMSMKPARTSKTCT